MNERRRLCEGDLVSFGGGSRIKIAPGTPDEANPYIFRVKRLQRVFEASAPQTNPEQNLEATQQPTSSSLQAECIDLTVSVQIN